MQQSSHSCVVLLCELSLWTVAESVWYAGFFLWQSWTGNNLERERGLSYYTDGMQRVVYRCVDIKRLKIGYFLEYLFIVLFHLF